MLALPLKTQTPKAWAERVLENPLALLCDHAYLERKAASNALDLMNRWVDSRSSEQWAMTLSNVAKDEAAHLFAVAKLISERGGKLSRAHKCRYASDLRALVRAGKGNLEVLDRLLVSALIEARSCERFLILAETATEPDLKRLYESLFASEAGHYKTFLKLAETTASVDDVEARWEEMLTGEADIIAAQPVGFALHSGA
ncbi:MAG: tRNA isopentenyl-2-thiomethyl-A-37 hydroxylase MiaE [Chloroherpetonaceae bacterium]|nr:tRNA isopentenyl-2-thiomethyl-A-37 hydroxylase MiaE [Chloroherpetonaceae bacterium]